MKRITIYWITKDRTAIEKIRERFNIPSGTTINGETPADIEDCDFPILEETAKRGFIQIRYK